MTSRPASRSRRPDPAEWSWPRIPAASGTGHGSCPRGPSSGRAPSGRTATCRRRASLPGGWDLVRTRVVADARTADRRGRSPAQRSARAGVRIRTSSRPGRGGVSCGERAGFRHPPGAGPAGPGRAARRDVPGLVRPGRFLAVADGRSEPVEHDRVSLGRRWRQPTGSASRAARSADGVSVVHGPSISLTFVLLVTPHLRRSR